MAETLTINWGNLDRMLHAYNEVEKQGGQIEDYVRSDVCNTVGFDYEACALQPIAGELHRIGDYFGDMRSIFTTRWAGVTDAVIASAKDVDRTDNSVSFDFNRYAGSGARGPYAPQGPTDLSVDVEFFTLNEPSDELKPPGEGNERLDHDPAWEGLSSGYDELVSQINSGIGKINSLGVVHIPPVDDTSLDERLVYPLSGNYRAIQGNAEACTNVADALGVWGTNFSVLSAKTFTALQGETSAALVLHLNLYNLVMHAIELVATAGSTAFSAVALASERIAVAVEKALVTLLKILGRVAKRIASRVLSYFGWVVLAADLVQRGFDAITDIWDDIQEVKEIITACWGLLESIKAWAEGVAEDLKAFEEIVAMVRELPEINGAGGLGGMPRAREGTVETSLGSIHYDFGDPSDLGPLDEDLTDLEDEYADQEIPDEEENDEYLMAPGPMEPPVPGLPGYPPSDSSGTGLIV